MGNTMWIETVCFFLDNKTLGELRYPHPAEHMHMSCWLVQLNDLTESMYLDGP